jgi:hypothetical protein
MACRAPTLVGRGSTSQGDLRCRSQACKKKGLFVTLQQAGRSSLPNNAKPKLVDGRPKIGKGRRQQNKKNQSLHNYPSFRLPNDLTLFL